MTKVARDYEPIRRWVICDSGSAKGIANAENDLGYHKVHDVGVSEKPESLEILGEQFCEVGMFLFLGGVDLYNGDLR